MLPFLTVQSAAFVNAVQLVACCPADHTLIAKMTDQDGVIVRMFRWHVISGRNMATLTDLSLLPPGGYDLTFMDTHGTILQNIELTKAASLFAGNVTAN